MATNPAKEKSSGRAKAPEKGAHTQAMEKGACIICGEVRTGTPAAPEFPVRAARRIRSILKQPAKHTIACKAHLAEARGKRAKFGKKVRDYLIGAVLFFILAVAGGFYFGNGDLKMFVPAFLGALIIALLPFFYYFPSFEK